MDWTIRAKLAGKELRAFFGRRTRRDTGFKHRESPCHPCSQKEKTSCTRGCDPWETQPGRQGETGPGTNRAEVEFRVSEYIEQRRHFAIFAVMKRDACISRVWEHPCASVTSQSASELDAQMSISAASLKDWMRGNTSLLPCIVGLRRR